LQFNEISGVTLATFYAVVPPEDGEAEGPSLESIRDSNILRIVLLGGTYYPPY
jgi:hypothetical protein